MPLSSRAALNSPTMRSRSLADAPSGTRSLSCRLTPIAPHSASFSTMCTGVMRARTGSPKGSRPTLPTVHSPKLKRSARVGSKGSPVFFLPFFIAEASPRILAETRRIGARAERRAPARLSSSSRERGWSREDGAGLEPGAPERPGRGEPRGRDEHARGLAALRKRRERGPRAGTGRGEGLQLVHEPGELAQALLLGGERRGELRARAIDGAGQLGEEGREEHLDQRTRAALGLLGQDRARALGGRALHRRAGVVAETPRLLGAGERSRGSLRRSEERAPRVVGVAPQQALAELHAHRDRVHVERPQAGRLRARADRKSTRLNSSHL